MSDKDKWVELSERLKKQEEHSIYNLAWSHDLIKEIKPEVEQLVRWWNLQMDEWNYGKQKLEMMQLTSNNTKNWELVLFNNPNLKEDLVIRVGRYIDGIDNHTTDYYQHFFDGEFKCEDEGGEALSVLAHYRN